MIGEVSSELTMFVGGEGRRRGLLQVEEQQGDLVHQGELRQSALYNFSRLLLQNCVDVVPGHSFLTPSSFHTLPLPDMSEDEFLPQPVERPQAIESYVETAGAADLQL